MALDVNTFISLNNEASEIYQTAKDNNTNYRNTLNNMPSVIGVIPEELKDLNLDSQKGD